MVAVLIGKANHHIMKTALTDDQTSIPCADRLGRQFPSESRLKNLY